MYILHAIWDLLFCFVRFSSAMISTQAPFRLQAFLTPFGPTIPETKSGIIAVGGGGGDCWFSDLYSSILLTRPPDKPKTRKKLLQQGEAKENDGFYVHGRFVRRGPIGVYEMNSIMSDVEGTGAERFEQMMDVMKQCSFEGMFGFSKPHIYAACSPPSDLHSPRMHICFPISTHQAYTCALRLPLTMHTHLPSDFHSPCIHIQTPIFALHVPPPPPNKYSYAHRRHWGYRITRF